MYSTSQDRNKKNIVIVEDDRTTAKILEIQLVRLGYHIPHIFSSTSEALREIDRYAPDLLIMGVSFPGDIDGIEAAGLLALEKDIPLVFLTASMDPVTYQRAMQVRPTGYIVKPPDKLKLQEVLTAAFTDRASNPDQLPGTSQGIVNMDKPEPEIHKTVNH